MTPTQAVELTGYIEAHFPSQPVNDYTADALSETLAAYPANDCRRAVLNIAERGEQWCAPTAVKAEVKRIRAKRVADYGPIEPPAGIDPDDVRGYQRWLGNMHREIADGTVTTPPMLEESRYDVADLGQLGQEIPDA